MSKWTDTLAGWLPKDILVRRDAQPAATKAVAANGGFISLYGPGRASWSGRNIAAFADEGFAGNPVAFRCVSMLADAVSSLPWLLYDGAQEVKDHPLLDLLRRPGPGCSGSCFLHRLTGQLQTAGSAYVHAVRLGDAVRELHLLRPDRVSLVIGSDGWPEAYEYTAAGRVTRFPAEPGNAMDSPVLHLKLLNPLDATVGVAPFQPAARAVDIHNAASAWSKALFDNAARPSGALVYAPKSGDQNLTEEQFTRLKQELEGNYQGAVNAGRPMVLEGGLDWKQISHSPRDMDHIEARNQAAREIAMCFGVPPMLLGIPGDATYANFAEANRSFWRQSVMPLAGRLADDISNWLCPTWGETLTLRLDADNVDALSAERDAAWRRIDQASFLTDAEKREAAGYSPVVAEPAQ